MQYSSDGLYIFLLEYYVHTLIHYVELRHNKLF